MWMLLDYRHFHHHLDLQYLEYQWNLGILGILQ
jgi:hypothetical protein